MEVLQPQQATVFFNNFSLPALKNEHRITKQIIEAIPADKGEYRPDAVSKTALELAWHIVAAEHRFMEGIAAGQFDFTPNHRPDSMRDSARIAEWYAKTFEADFARLTKLNGEQLTKVVDFRGMFQLPAIAYVQFNLHHSIHHRGQLSVYLRLNDVPVPSIYGPSADEGQL